MYWRRQNFKRIVHRILLKLFVFKEQSVFTFLGNICRLIIVSCSRFTCYYVWFMLNGYEWRKYACSKLRRFKKFELILKRAILLFYGCVMRCLHRRRQEVADHAVAEKVTCRSKYKTKISFKGILKFFYIFRFLNCLTVCWNPEHLTPFFALHQCSLIIHPPSSIALEVFMNSLFWYLA